MLEIGGLLPFTTIDYPGRLAAVLFCQGCPWRCGYCHNRHLIPTMDGTAVPWLEIVALLRSRCGLLDAVVFSGGEPTMQAGLSDAMKEVRGMGFAVGLHTAGPYPGRLLDYLPHLDWVGMDLKAPFEEYERITGMPGSGEAARKSAELLRRSGVPHQFRTTLAPFLEKEERIGAMQSMVAQWGEELVVQRMKIDFMTRIC
jgi:pyruvate formate lyase activating enzyme